MEPPSPGGISSGAGNCSTHKFHPCDEAVIATNDDASDCKRCAVRLGYWKDDYIGYFVRNQERKAPEINRGYFARVKGVEMCVEKFLKVSVGAVAVTFTGNGMGWDGRRAVWHVPRSSAKARPRKPPSPVAPPQGHWPLACACPCWLGWPCSYTLIQLPLSVAENVWKLSDHQFGLRLRHALLSPKGHRPPGEELHRAGLPHGHCPQMLHNQTQQSLAGQDPRRGRRGAPESHGSARA